MQKKNFVGKHAGVSYWLRVFVRQGIYCKAWKNARFQNINYRHSKLFKFRSPTEKCMVSIADSATTQAT